MPLFSLCEYIFWQGTYISDLAHSRFLMVYNRHCLWKKNRVSLLEVPDLFRFCWRWIAPERFKRSNQVKSASSLRVPLSGVGERDIARGVKTGQELAEMSTVGVGPCGRAHTAHVLPQNFFFDKKRQNCIGSIFWAVWPPMVKMSTIGQLSEKCYWANF